MDFAHEFYCGRPQVKIMLYTCICGNYFVKFVIISNYHRLLFVQIEKVEMLIMD